MRARAISLVLLLAVLRPATSDVPAPNDPSATNTADDDDDIDLDDDDLDDDDEDERGAPPANEGVEDFDLAMPEEDQKKRMESCLVLTMSRVRAHSGEKMQNTVMEVRRQQQLTEEQAVNRIVFSWMMACYMNIDLDGMKKAQNIDMSGLSPELEAEIFGQRKDRPQQMQQASRRQWQLLESVVMKNKDKLQGAQPAGSNPLPAASGFSGQSQAIYVLVVFGMLFGCGGIFVFKMIRSEQNSKFAKTAKKAEKAEKKLSKRSR